VVTANGTAGIKERAESNEGTGRIAQAYRAEEGSDTLPIAVGRIAFLTDRSHAEALPALTSLGLDVKTLPVSPDSVSYLTDLAPELVVVDAMADPEAAFSALSLLAAVRAKPAPVMAVVGHADLDRFAWDQVVDELVRSDASASELRLRLAILTRRTGGAGEATLRLGPLAMSRDTYQVAVSGRVLDLTYKEFELLRFLVEHAGRVYTRTELLSEVWGYNFYGGTRTVDVHVRRLRAKLGPEHEGLIQTVRGVGYRSAAERDGTSP